MPAYIAELIDYLSDSFDTGYWKIKIRQVLDPINLDPALAVPIGLILNEAITNAIKYAFDREGGDIVVSLLLQGENAAILKVADTGRGLPPDFDFCQANSLGMEMMKALSKQLGGYFKMENSNGALITVEFRTEKQLSNIERKTFVAN